MHFAYIFHARGRTKQQKANQGSEPFSSNSSACAARRHLRQAPVMAAGQAARQRPSASRHTWPQGPSRFYVSEDFTNSPVFHSPQLLLAPAPVCSDTKRKVADRFHNTPVPEGAAPARRLGVQSGPARAQAAAKTAMLQTARSLRNRTSRSPLPAHTSRDTTKSTGAPASAEQQKR